MATWKGAGKGPGKSKAAGTAAGVTGGPPRRGKLFDARVVYCGDCLEQRRNLPDDCIDLIYIDPPGDSNRNYGAFWGETKERRVFEVRATDRGDAHAL